MAPPNNHELTKEQGFQNPEISGTTQQELGGNGEVVAVVEDILERKSGENLQTAATETLEDIAAGGNTAKEKKESPLPDNFTDGLMEEIQSDLDSKITGNPAETERVVAQTTTEANLEKESAPQFTPAEAQQSSIDVLTQIANNPNAKDAEGIRALAEVVRKGNLAPDLVANVQHNLKEHATRIPDTVTPRDLKISSELRLARDQITTLTRDENRITANQEGYLQQQIELSRLGKTLEALRTERTAIRAQKEEEKTRIMVLAENADLLTQTTELTEETDTAAISAEKAQQELAPTTDPTAEVATPLDEVDKPNESTASEDNPEEPTPENPAKTEENLPEEIRSNLELLETNIDKLPLEELRKELEETINFRELVSLELEMVSGQIESTLAQHETNEVITVHYDILIKAYQDNPDLKVPPELEEKRAQVMSSQEELNQRLKELNEDKSLLENLDQQAQKYQESIENRIKDLETTNKKADYELPPGVYDLISNNPQLRESLTNELKERKKNKTKAPSSLIGWFLLLFQLRKVKK